MLEVRYALPNIFDLQSYLIITFSAEQTIPDIGIIYFKIFRVSHKRNQKVGIGIKLPYNLEMS